MTEDRFPLSATQQRFCLGDLGDEAGTFGPRFTSEIAVRITGAMDLDALRAALDDVVRRHEILRTIVVRDASPRYQQVYPPAPATLEVHDLPPVDEAQRPARVQQILASAARHDLRVRDLPLLRAELHRFDEQDSLLVVCSHHTAADGWSIQVLLRDLAACYRARCLGQPPQLPDAPQYRDFVAWEQARCEGAADTARRYWQQKLAGAGLFALPVDRVVTGAYSRPYSAYYFTVDPAVTTELLRLAKTTRSSAFMVLLAAFNVLATGINQNPDVVVTSFSSGRNDPSLHDIVGSVVNSLPLRTQIADCVTFRDVLLRTRQTCLEAYAHEIPADRIEAQAPQLRAPLREPGRCRFFAFSMFVSHVEDSLLEFADGSYQVREEVLQEESEGADLGGGFVWDMDLVPSGELTGTLRFNLDEFDQQTVVGWVSAFRRILAGGVLDPDAAWRQL
jgi:condensation enzyme